MPRQRLYPDEKTISLSIRIPASLKDKLHKRAVRNRRSLNQEIVWLIQKAIAMIEDEEPVSGDK